jgi:hypothetical protein
VVGGGSDGLAYLIRVLRATPGTHPGGRDAASMAQRWLAGTRWGRDRADVRPRDGSACGLISTDLLGGRRAVSYQPWRPGWVALEVLT